MAPRAGQRALGTGSRESSAVQPEPGSPNPRGSHSTRTSHIQSTQPGGSRVAGSTQPGGSRVGGGLASSSTDRGWIPPPDPCRTGTWPCLRRPPGEGLGWVRGPGMGGRLRFGLPGCCWWRSGTTPVPASPPGSMCAGPGPGFCCALGAGSIVVLWESLDWEWDCLGVSHTRPFSCFPFDGATCGVFSSLNRD